MSDWALRGFVVNVLWVRMDWTWAIQGEMTGDNPFQEGTGIGWGLAAIRIFGASIVVPTLHGGTLLAVVFDSLGS